MRSRWPALPLSLLLLASWPGCGDPGGGGGDPPPMGRMPLKLAFKAADNYPAFVGGNSFDSVITGDFNGDGKLDLATLGGGNKVNLLLGKGDGKFDKAVAFDAGADAQSFAAANLDGGAAAEIVVANYNNNQLKLNTLKWDGAQLVTTEMASSIDPKSMGGVAPFGGTGLVFAIQDGLAVFSGGAFTSFLKAVDANNPGVPRHVLSADFNKDGKPDVAYLENGRGAVVLWLAGADGSFAGKDMRLLPGAGDMRGLAAADVDGDGDNDLAVAGASNQTGIVYVNDGQAGFTRKDLPVNAGEQKGIIDSCAAGLADFNDDGKPDLAIVNGLGPKNGAGGTPGLVTLFKGKGDGDFDPIPDPPGLVVSQAPAGNFSRAIAVGDFDKDGKVDLAVASNIIDEFVSVFLNDSKP